MTMSRYRCIFWGFLFSCFSINLFGLKLLPGFIALGIFAYGIYGLYIWREDESFRAAGIAASMAALLDFFSTLFTWMEVSLPAYGYYLPLCAHYIALGCTFFLLFSGLQNLFRTRDGSFPKSAASACRHGLYVLPALYTLAIILYGIIMVMRADWKSYLILAAGVLELCIDLYALYLLSYFKAFIKGGHGLAVEPEYPQQQAAAQSTDCPLEQE